MNQGFALGKLSQRIFIKNIMKFIVSDVVLELNCGGLLAFLTVFLPFHCLRVILGDFVPQAMV